MSDCPTEGYFKNVNTNQCEACASTCKSCSGSLNTNCLSCATPLFLKNYKCVSDCENFYCNLYYILKFKH